MAYSAALHARFAVIHFLGYEAGPSLKNCTFESSPAKYFNGSFPTAESPEARDTLARQFNPNPLSSAERERATRRSSQVLNDC